MPGGNGSWVRGKVGRHYRGEILVFQFSFQPFARLGVFIHNVPNLRREPSALSCKSLIFFAHRS